MLKKPFQATKHNIPLLLAFILPLLYWIYLALICEIIIVHDSLGYEQLGSLLARQQWLEYFKSGPNREPLYPFVISLSMQIAHFFSVSYLSVQKIIQILIVCLTQFLTLHILQRLNIGRFLTAATILYLGFSPVIVNSIFNIYSEVITYPIILGIILINLKCWDVLSSSAHSSLSQDHFPRAITLAVLFSTLFILLTFIKGIFELILPIAIMPFVFKFFAAGIQKRKNTLTSFLVFLSVFLGLYYGIVLGYKSINKFYNGQFVLTDRGAGIFYGNTMRRVTQLTPQRLLTDLSYLPDPDGHFCARYFEKEQCIFESYKNSDIFAFKKSMELQAQGLSKKEFNRIFLKMAFAEIRGHPFQYLFLTFFESLRTFSWESTTPKFVVYPEWIDAILNQNWLNRCLNFSLTLLTVISLGYSVFFLRRKDANSSDRRIISCILWLIGAYWAAHSLFLVILRHILPIVPLYLILIAFFLQQTVFKKQNHQADHASNALH